MVAVAEPASDAVFTDASAGFATTVTVYSVAYSSPSNVAEVAVTVWLLPSQVTV